MAKSSRKFEMNLKLIGERLLLGSFAKTDVDVEVEIGTDPNNAASLDVT